MKKINWIAVLAGVAFYMLIATILNFLGVDSILLKLTFSIIIGAFAIFIDSRKRNFKRKDTYKE